MGIRGNVLGKTDRRRRLPATAGLGLSLAALAAFAAACGSSSSTDAASSSAAPAAAPSSAAASPASGSTSGTTIDMHSGDMGSYLTDSKGNTLYLYTPDSSTKSACTGTCAAQWPPVTTKTAPQAGSGIDASKLTTISRDGGVKQVAYNGHPLYLFAGDSAAGDIKGQGLGKVWYIESPAGAEIKTAASGGSAAPSASSSSSSSSSTSGSDAGGGWS